MACWLGAYTRVRTPIDLDYHITTLKSVIGSPLVLAGTVLVAGYLLTRLAFRASPITHFLCQLASFVGFTAMLAVARVSPFTPTPPMDVSLTYATISIFKIVWWLAASWLLAGFVSAVLVFKRQPTETRFLQDLCAGAIYISGVIGIVADVFGIPVSGVLAASGVLAIVLGLALQSTLGDVFSGIVLNLAKPYRPGDWVIVDGTLEGRVVETNWRGTQLLTESNDIATVPNSVISKAKLVNASQPSEAHGIRVRIRLDPAIAPSYGVGVLETAMLSCNLMLHAPRAYVTVKSLDALALECELFFFITPMERAPDAQNEVFDRVYRHCASAGIRLAPPRESSLLLPPQPRSQDPTGAPARLLARLPIFAPLSDDERLLLAPKMKRCTFKAADIIVEQGVAAGALFILGSGVLAGIRHAGSRDDEVLRYAPGDCFGQASVLTGAVTSFRVQALTPAVVYEITKADISPILKARPSIAAELAQIMSRRQADWNDRLSRLNPPPPHADNLAARLAIRIRSLFALSD